MLIYFDCYPDLDVLNATIKTFFVVAGMDICKKVAAKNISEILILATRQLTHTHTHTHILCICVCAYLCMCVCVCVCVKILFFFNWSQERKKQIFLNE